MLSIINNLEVELFAFDEIIKTKIIEGWQFKAIPNILLSSVKNLSYDVVAEFETMNIYDLEDLTKYESILSDKLSSNLTKVKKIRELAIQACLTRFNIPNFIMKLPENYAVITINQDEIRICVAISWRNLLFKWNMPQDSDLLRIISEIKTTLEYCNFPKLITDIRNWNFKSYNDLDVDDLSVYLANFDVLKTLNVYCQNLNIPPFENEVHSICLLNLYNIEFIIWLAHKTEKISN